MEIEEKILTEETNVSINDILGTENKRISVADILRIEAGVLHFNEVMGNNPDNKDLVDVYKNLTTEELNECIKYEAEGNLPEVLDGIIDCCFTGLYLNRVHEGCSLYEEVEFLEDLCSGEYQEYEWSDLLDTLEHNEYSNFVARFIYKVVAESEKYDIMGAFDRVYESNMSKCISKNDVVSGLISLEAAMKEVENAGRYTNLFFDETDTHFILKARLDLRENKVYDSGKIIKIESLYLSPEYLGGLRRFIYEK